MCDVVFEDYDFVLYEGVEFGFEVLFEGVKGFRVEDLSLEVCLGGLFVFRVYEEVEFGDVWVLVE